GAQNDIQQATNIAKTMVTELGMSDKIGPVNYAMQADSGFLGREHGLASDISPDTMEAIHQEIRSIIQQQYDRARQIIIEHRKLLDTIAECLLEHETITGEEVAALARGDDFGEFRAAQARAYREARPVGLVLEKKEREKKEKKDEPDVGLSGAEGLAHS